MCVSENGRGIIEKIPRNKVLTETDAPYNEQCDIDKVICDFYGIWDVSPNDVEQVIDRNFRTLLKDLNKEWL